MLSATASGTLGTRKGEQHNPACRAFVERGIVPAGCRLPTMEQRPQLTSLQLRQCPSSRSTT
jgi:hypothetical protein